jgi:hypothetical protein
MRGCGGEKAKNPSSKLQSPKGKNPSSKVQISSKPQWANHAGACSSRWLRLESSVLRFEVYLELATWDLSAKALGAWDLEFHFPVKEKNPSSKL